MIEVGQNGRSATGPSRCRASRAWFSVEIEAEAFTGLNRLARQRAVNAALANMLEGRVHALAIRASAPGE